MPQPDTIAIIGGGPAGLSAARLLAERGVRETTLFEARPRVGGKSHTVRHRGVLHEMGTCYSTLAHRTSNRWMRDLGVKQRALGEQLMDGAPYMEWVKAGPGEPLLLQGPRFIRLWYAFQRALKAAPNDPEVRAMAAAPIENWLARHKLHRARKFMLRAVTNLGYGRLDEVPTVQALAWCTPTLLVSGLLNRLHMPRSGWQNFWERLAKGLHVRADEPVLGVERDADGVTVTTKNGATRFDDVVVTIPPDDFASVAALTPDEADIRDGMAWGRYATTLCEAANWFERGEIEAYSAALESDAPPGALLSARLAPDDVKGAGGGRLYVAGQYAVGLDEHDLQTALTAEIEARGGRVLDLVDTCSWKYFPCYRREAVEDGLLERMKAIQGANRTWWSGAAFSHEAVSNIVEHNVRLTRDIARAAA